MLFRLAWLPAIAFLAAAGYANVLFALTLSPDVAGRALWVGVALASTMWTIVGLSVCASATGRCRKAAAMLLLAMALSYDALAAYGLAKAEQAAAAEPARRAATAAEAVRRQLSAARTELATYADVPATIVARAREKAARGRQARDEAELLVARAVARDAAEAHLRDAESRAQQLPPVAVDARSGLIPPDVVAWLPVALVLLGGLLGPYSLEKPTVAPLGAPVPGEPAARAESVAPEAPPAARAEPAPVAVSPEVEPLIRLYARPPVPLDKGGWLRLPQRRLATALGVSPTRLNKTLRAAADQGAIALDTSAKGTAFRAMS